MRSLGVVTYNLYMRPTTLFWNGQAIRAKLLPAPLDKPEFDVLILHELFDDEVREDLLDRLKNEKMGSESNSF